MTVELFISQVARETGYHKSEVREIMRSISEEIYKQHHENFAPNLKVLPRLLRHGRSLYNKRLENERK